MDASHPHSIRIIDHLATCLPKVDAIVNEALHSICLHRPFDPTAVHRKWMRRRVYSQVAAVKHEMQVEHRFQFHRFRISLSVECFSRHIWTGGCRRDSALYSMRTMQQISSANLVIAISLICRRIPSTYSCSRICFDPILRITNVIGSCGRFAILRFESEFHLFFREFTLAAQGASHLDEDSIGSVRRGTYRNAPLSIAVNGLMNQSVNADAIIILLIANDNWRLCQLNAKREINVSMERTPHPCVECQATEIKLNFSSNWNAFHKS